MWPFKRTSESDKILKQHLDRDFSVFACREDAPSEETIQEFEQEFGFRLPEEFRAFSKSPLGGIYIEVKEEIWPRHKEFAVAPFWTFLYGMFTFSFSHKTPPFMDIRMYTRAFRKYSNTRLVPFLKVMGDANVYCFDEHGAVRRWDHETDDATLIEKNFTAVFAHEVEELRKRKEKKKAEAGSL